MSSREFGRTCPLRPGTRWRGHHRVRHRIQRSARWTPSLIASSYGPLQSAGGVPFSQELLVKAERYNCVPPRGARISCSGPPSQCSGWPGRGWPVTGATAAPRAGEVRCADDPDGATARRSVRTVGNPRCVDRFLERGATSPREGLQADRPRQPLRWPTCSTLKKWWPDSASVPRRCAPGACPP